MKLPQKNIGVEQVGEEQVEHTVIDFRPVLAFAAFFFFTLAALIVTEATR